MGSEMRPSSPLSFQTEEQHPSMRRDRYSISEHRRSNGSDVEFAEDKPYLSMEIVTTWSRQVEPLPPPSHSPSCRREGNLRSSSAASVVSYTRPPQQYQDDNDTATTTNTTATSTTDLQPLQDLLRDNTGGQARLYSANSEVDILGSAWRTILNCLLVWCMDDINALRLSRSLQLFLPYLTCYESFLLGQVVKVMAENKVHKSKRTLSRVLTVAFKNRNVSRIIVQQVQLRFDWLWHWCFRLRHNRGMDSWGQFPIVGISSFPATENFPNTRNHALASMFRVILGEGWWISRAITKREGLLTDNQLAVAQNLAAGTFSGKKSFQSVRFM